MGVMGWGGFDVIASVFDADGSSVIVNLNRSSGSQGHPGPASPPGRGSPAAVIEMEDE
jgi:hypothetical protein